MGGQVNIISMLFMMMMMMVVMMMMMVVMMIMMIMMIMMMMTMMMMTFQGAREHKEYAVSYGHPPSFSLHSLSCWYFCIFIVCLLSLHSEIQSLNANTNTQINEN